MIATAGAAWGGAKVSLNGTRERVRDIDVKLDRHISSDEDVQTQLLLGLARVEVMLDERTTKDG